VSSNDFPWNEILKKEARGIDDADFGEIQSVDPEYVITQKGIIDKEFFFIAINLVQGMNYISINNYICKVIFVKYLLSIWQKIQYVK